jgi:hypothetical protein
MERPSGERPRLAAGLSTGDFREALGVLGDDAAGLPGRLTNDWVRPSTVGMIGVRPSGTKEVIVGEDGDTESAESGKTVPRDLGGHRHMKHASGAGTIGRVSLDMRPAVPVGLRAEIRAS